MVDINTTLIERAKTHGRFEYNAQTYCNLRMAIDPWPLGQVQYAALDMILMKLARVTSTPSEPDHWRDIAGYATLVVRHLEGEK